MKNNWENNINIVGYVWNHNLSIRTTGENSKNPGTEFINGTIGIATDNDGLNIVNVRYTYETEVWAKSGKKNSKFGILKKIIDDNPVGSEKGLNNAMKVNLTATAAVNIFRGRDNEIVEGKTIAGGFINEGWRAGTQPGATFNFDMIITGVVDQEPEGRDPYVNLNGYVVDDYRQSLIPLQISCTGKDGVKYFQAQDASTNEPFITNVWGNIINTVQEVKTETKSAFGAPKVNSTPRTFRVWDVTGASEDSLEFDDESTLTAKEYKKMVEDYAEYKASEIKRIEEYEASRNSRGNGFPANGSESRPIAATSASDYKF